MTNIAAILLYGTVGRTFYTHITASINLKIVLIIEVKFTKNNFEQHFLDSELDSYSVPQLELIILY